MADDNKGVTSGGPPPPGEVKKDGGDVDERGVSWKNAAMEYQRKFQETQEVLKSLQTRLSALEPKPASLGVEEAKQAKLMALAEDPEAFVQLRIEERLLQKEALETEEWLNSQKDWKPELEAEIIRVIRENNLGGRPLQRAKAALKLLKVEKPDLFPGSVKVSDRENAVRKYITEGPGRSGVVPAPKSEERQQLLKQFSEAQERGDMGLMAQISNQLAVNYFGGQKEEKE